MALSNKSSSGTVHYDGIYQCVASNQSIYLRFFPDGRVVGAEASEGPIEVSRWLNHEYINHGLYGMNGSGIEFEIRTPQGVYNYIGKITNGKLNVNSYSKIDFSVQEYEFSFVPIQGLYVEPQVSNPAYNRNANTSTVSTSSRKNLTKSIICMACGIASIVLSSYGIGLIPAIISIVINMSCRRNGEQNGFTKAGMITSVIGILFSIIMGLVTCSAAMASNSLRYS